MQSEERGAPLYYIATMIAADHEDDERIIRHREEREGWGFTTIEHPRDIEKILHGCNPDGSFLLDSLTALLANEMFLPGGEINRAAGEKIADGLLSVMNELRHIVIVSDYIYCDAISYDPLTELYRKSLAALDRLAAQHCDVVLEVAHAQTVIHKSIEERMVAGFEIY